MSFLQPLMLFALPAIALPILIHLLNRRRHLPVRWGPMMFLIDAKKMARGMARLKQWLILALRTLAIAGLIFAASRPLSSGWLGVAAGGPPDTILVLLDRSVSMEDQDLQSGRSKRATALEKIAELIEAWGEGPRIVLIESTRQEPIAIESAESLLDLPQTEGTSTAADIAALLESADDYIKINETGRTDVWLCSDLRRSDWDPQGGRWPALRERFLQRESVRFYLLCYPDLPSDNVTITVPRVERRQVGSRAEIVLDLQLKRAEASRPLELPIEIVLNGARSVLPVELIDTELLLQGHTIPIDPEVEEGHGRVEIPRDGNPLDNVIYFAFADRPERRAVVVSEDPVSARALRIAAGSSLDPAIATSAIELSLQQTNQIEWDATALILWQAPLPDGIVAQQLEDFVARGRALIVFPSQTPNDRELFGLRWSTWREDPGVAMKISTWRWDTDLLANAASGRSLPIGELETYRFCSLQGPGRDLARFDSGDALLRRATRDGGGGVYFCSTLPRASHSSLARDGIALYVMVQRALESGAASLARARQLTTGEQSMDGWEVVASSDSSTLPSERDAQAGVYHLNRDWIAVNRPPSEDQAEIVSDDALARLFEGLRMERVDDEVGSSAGLANEVWQIFLIVMGLCLLGEAWLSMPERKVARGGASA